MIETRLEPEFTVFEGHENHCYWRNRIRLPEQVADVNMRLEAHEHERRRIAEIQDELDVGPTLA